MNSAAISVLVPARNAAATLGETIDSVLAQTFRAWELIVVDDGSTDDTAALVEAYGDERIRLIRQQCQGVSAARNRAFAESQGELLAFLDADDRWATTKLAAQSEFLERRSDVGSTYCAHRRVDLDGAPWTLQAPPWEVGYRDFLIGFPFNPSAQIVRREWHVKAGGLEPGLAIHEDRDYWLRLCAQGCRFARTPGVLADYRLGPPKPSANPLQTARQALRVLDRALERPLAAIASEADRRRARFDILREWAFQAAISGQPADAADLFAEISALAPDLALDPRQRDDFLQSIVDLSVRTRGDHEPMLQAIFGALPEALVSLRGELRWATGCGAVLQGARELLWARYGAAEERFEHAATLGAGLDARTCNLLRYDLRQFADVAEPAEVSAAMERLAPALAALTSQQEAGAFVRSVREAAASPSGLARVKQRLTGWLGAARA